MKRYTCSPKYILRQKITLLLLTLCLLCIVKFIKVEKILKKSPFYVVEPHLFFSEITSNKQSFQNDPVNCTAIYELEPVEIGKSLEIRRKRILDLDDKKVETLTQNCTAYKNLRQYHMKSLSAEEKNFPIAYSIVVHKDAINIERLFYTIYSPWNVYCIHYDEKSSPVFKAVMTNLAKCFSNVFIASKIERVTYAHISRLKADLNCLSDLLKSTVQWKYVINLCGQDMPLKSNFELVSELKKLNGKNMLESSRPSNLKKDRYIYHHEIQDASHIEYMQMPAKTSILKDPPPHKLEIFVGSAYFVLSRQFINYILDSQLVIGFLDWSKDTFSPDEHFWATLARLPGIPGEIPRRVGDVTDLQSKTRLVKWSYLEDSIYPSCTGTHIRSVCIYGAAELRWLLTSEHWFGNKFDPKVDPVLVKCLIEKLEERQREQVNFT
ncbi:beta-1,3-galactosyl-O-glycosyl-glycoprotein beta-1,6-N-acetylglucosaminyltransferase 4 [Bombina bombina]|uniref:beta-1,3-galactosyl-O-glycosyl-glycoprotein beta-1,6-N-acetylglucosaminyltransferase 4 n=1 Tax=Bombina bombina TaxID=8345 RepID=UPI00235ACB88|nr:beta-1,3-galactosyl-O-glycosyl-glycoprotein beta-1,6-N-acetylglucosaminyltransferase 4 [Bombina bombina]